MKPSVRKDQEPIFNVFHELNLKDAMSYVAEVLDALLTLGKQTKGLVMVMSGK